MADVTIEGSVLGTLEQPDAQQPGVLNVLEANAEVSLINEPAAPEVADGSLLTEGGGEEGDVKETEAAIEYNLKVPEEYSLAPEVLDKYIPLLQKHGVTQDGAQELADLHMDLLRRADEIGQQARKEIVEGWKEEIKADPEFGGENFKENIALARSGLRAVMPTDKEGAAALSELLDSSGFGNHPEVVKMFARIGRMVKEDSKVLEGRVDGVRRGVTPADFFPKTLGREI